MAVSYLSSVVESNPYVVPIDLGLLQKVNDYKQSQFYENTDKLNTQFQQLNSLDITNPEQNAYAKNVVNNLQTQINNMGGLDYSDPSVSNQISGYAGSVYNDKTILNGIISTKGFRSYQANTEKMRTDPKLAKYYDPAREWYDMQNTMNPNSYANYVKGGINASYNGPTAPTPSLGSDWDLLTKEITKINPNITTQIDQSGNKFFLDKTTNKEVTNSQIRQMVDGQIDGRVADQLNVHAAYNYYALTNGTYDKEMGTTEFNKYNTDNYQRINDGIANLQTQITQEPDNQKRLDLEQRLQDLTAELPNAQKAVQQGAKDFSNLWDKDPQAAFYNLYTNKLKNDIASVYSYKQTQQQLIVNQEEVANSRLDIEAMKLGAKIQRNADGTMKLIKADKHGEFLDPPLLGQLQPDLSSSEDLNKKAIDAPTIQAEIKAKYNEVNSGLRDILFETGKIANVPGLFPDNESINNDPTANPISHSDLLKQVGQLSGDQAQIERSDIDNVVSNAMKQGTFDANGNFTFTNPKGTAVNYLQNGKQIVSLTAPQITFFKKVQGIMDDAADGKDISGRIANAGNWRTFMNKYSIEQNAIENSKRVLQTATDQATDAKLNSYTYLTPDDRKQLKDFITNHSQYVTPGQGVATSTGGSFTSPQLNIDKVPVQMRSAISKVITHGDMHSMGDLQDNINSLLNNTANRNNYYSILLPDTNKDLGDEYPQIKNFMLNDAHVHIDPSIVTNKEDISPVSIVTDGIQHFIKYTNAKKTDKGFGYIPITDENLQSFGVPTVPYPSMEKTVSQNGHLFNPVYIDPLATDNAFNKANNFTGPLKVDIYNMNASGDRNNDNFTPAVLYNGKKYFYKPGNSKSANAALELLTNALQMNQTFKTVDQFINTLNQYNQK